MASRNCREWRWTQARSFGGCHSIHFELRAHKLDLVDGNLPLTSTRRVLKVTLMIIWHWIQQQTETILPTQDGIRFMNAVSRIHARLPSSTKTESSIPLIELLADICLLGRGYRSREAARD